MSTVSDIVRLVHRRDRLLEKKRRILAKLDHQIAKVDEQIKSAAKAAADEDSQGHGNRFEDEEIDDDDVNSEEEDDDDDDDDDVDDGDPHEETDPDEGIGDGAVFRPRRGDLQDAVLAIIRKSNGKALDYGEVALSLYGSRSSKFQHRVRNLLTALRKSGRIDRIGVRAWRCV